jgi:hypothetical protein
MSAPDLEQIAEVILLSEGYKSAKDLGRKIVSLYSLSRELLSPQQHYDWGLRALKTVLRASGHLLQVRCLGSRARFCYKFNFIIYQNNPIRFYNYARHHCRNRIY